MVVTLANLAVLGIVGLFGSILVVGLSISAPLLLLSGDADSCTPLDEAGTLLARAPPGTPFIAVPGAGQVDLAAFDPPTSDPPASWRAVRRGRCPRPAGASAPDPNLFRAPIGRFQGPGLGGSRAVPWPSA